MIGVRLGKIDLSAAAKRGADWKRKATIALVGNARIDTEPYVPKVTGNLIDTAKTESVPEAGKLVYGNAGVPYARAQYYGLPNKTTTYNPNACMQWFEASKAANLTRWVEIAKGEWMLT